MKKTNKVIAALLTVIILLAALPMGAYAASAIQSAEIELNAEPGIDAENWDSFINVKTKGLELVDLYVYDYYGDFVSNEFELGMEYEFYIYLKVQDGFELPDSIYEIEEVTVNGENVDFELYAMGEDEDEYNYIEIYYTMTIGGEITDVALNLDVYGEFSTYNYYSYVKIKSQAVDFMSSTYDAVLVYDDEGNLVDGHFEAGKEYKLEIYLSPVYSCNFNKNDNGEFELESVTVNGKEAEYSVHSYETNSYYEYIKIVTTVTAKKANFIKDIDIDIDTELKNKYVEQWNEYITINTDGLIFDDQNGDPAVFAYDSYGNWVEQYLPGETYNLYIYFTPEDGYLFTEDFSFDSVIVNGEEYIVSDYGSYYGENDKEIYYVGIEFEAEIPYDNFFARIAAFFQSIINIFRALFAFTDLI